ncbi:bifunctional sulfur carrier protein/thiazole synthase protein [bacterium BMS3Bbin14]|nr:bifunctional sulfur carrier protein/thiazole synthase protein [bacterium BMS3Abin13]GBE53056.1 bifunctional sulfur carrier protein/thiazole synthase protein [bacterium BMS3Bbin14]HDK43221.1 sulfur carrier protein ThiS [Desulfobacteraceae bacterium]HDO31364.1 sulfur carrier protein ThiS [Desulfobacteraceae bacterium]
MQIILNGQQKNLDHNITLSTLLDSLNLQPDTMVAEINGRIIKPGSYPQLELKDGDKVELIRFVGGG